MAMMLAAAFVLAVLAVVFMMLMLVTLSPAAPPGAAVYPVLAPVTASVPILIMFGPFGYRRLEGCGFTAAQHFDFSFLPDDLTAQ